jgi:Neocarzinostatin family
MGSTKTVIRLVCVLAALGLAVGACSSSSSSSSKKKSTTTTAKANTIPTATVTPSTGLTNGQTVTVVAKNFTPGKTIGVTECSTRDNESGSGCDLRTIPTGTIAADGTVTLQFKVESMNLGADMIDCTTGPHVCGLIAAELSADAKAQRADKGNIAFAA